MNHTSIPSEQIKRQTKQVEEILLTLDEGIEDEDTQNKKKEKKIEDIVSKVRIINENNLELLDDETSVIIKLKDPEIKTGLKNKNGIAASQETKRLEIQDKIINKLHENGIPTAIYYPKPLHLQRAFCELDYKRGDFPIAEQTAREIFSLPMHPYLQEDVQMKIIDQLIV